MALRTKARATGRSIIHLRRAISCDVDSVQQHTTGSDADSCTNAIWHVSGGGDAPRRQEMPEARALAMARYIAPVSRCSEASCYGLGDRGLPIAGPSIATIICQVGRVGTSVRRGLYRSALTRPASRLGSEE
jgi:hypothetical protein